MTLAIAQRRPLISTMRALGGRRRTIVTDLLSEAAVLGLVGGVTGSACGILLGRNAIDTLPATITQSLEARTEYLLPGYVVPLAVTAAVVTSVTATAVAARQVHRVAPVEALSPIGSGSLELASRPIRIGAGVLGAALVVASVALVTAQIGRLAMGSLALAFTGATTLAFACSGPLMRAAAAVARRCGSTGILGATSIERAPRRMLVATITVMIAVANATAVTGANSNVVDSTLASYASLGKAGVWVAASPATGYQSAPLPADTEARVRAVPGVGRVTPGQLAFGTVDGIRVMMLGVAPGSYQSMYQLLSVQSRAEFDAGHGVAVSRDLAQRMGAAAGDELLLQTPTGEHRVRVLAVLPVFAAVYGTVALNLQTMRDWYAAPAATNLEVAVVPGADPDNVARSVKAAVPQDLYVYSGPEMLAAVKAAVDANTAAIFAIVWIIIAVSAVTLLNTLMLSVLDRRREIGVLRALGATRRSTVNVIASEAIGVGVVGGLLGLVVGAASQFLAAHALTSVLGIDVIYRPQPAMLAIGLGALVICLLGSVPPAIRAARLNIVDAISVD
jgi:putative ABC transport system permease protein